MAQELGKPNQRRKFMLEAALVDHCSPTLAGIKTGNLFLFRSEGDDYIAEIRKLNRMLVKRGLRIIPVKRDDRKILIYVYRPERLQRDLTLPEAEAILREKGYPTRYPQQCVSCLIRHLTSDVEFPHEIGLFLGYPPSDVRCFMKDSREGVLCVGCWKAYGNVEEAEKTFEQFRKCTAIYRNLMKKGRPLEQLIVQDRKQQGSELEP